MPGSANYSSYDKSLGLYKVEDEQSLYLLLVLHTYVPILGIYKSHECRNWD
jgi:hypothetical protein